MSSAQTTLNSIIKDFTSYHLKDVPEYATTADVSCFNDRLQSLTPESFEERKNKYEGLLVSLQDVNREQLPKQDCLNYDILLDSLQTFIDGYQWRMHSAFNAVNFLENIHNNFTAEIIDATRFETIEDFISYEKRLKAIPKQVDEKIELMKLAISNKTTNHKSSVDRVPQQLKDFVKTDLAENPFFLPCKIHLPKIKDTSDAVKLEVEQSIKKAIIQSLNPSFENLCVYIEKEYIPKTRQQEGVLCLPEGDKFYQSCLRWHLSTNMSPQEVHNIGLKEVARISKCMVDIMKELGFNGTLENFFSLLRDDKSFYHESKEKLLQGYKDLMEKKIDPKLPQLFSKLPSMKCDVREMSFNGPGGQYIPPSDDGARPGVFQVNLTSSETIGTFGMPVLTLHEVSPGHHLQISLAIENNLPTFRNKLDYINVMFSAPFAFPIYTAYCEGWALYAEDLGLEMGIYETPYERFGKYSEEMFRACRLVVDTGLHAMGWSKQQAMDYMNSNCFMSPNEVETEVCRYITWPGQACGYKIGQLKIKELRKRAEESLGNKFDIKKFHSVILDLASVPLWILEREVNEWIVNTQE